MPNYSPDEKQDSPLIHKTESEESVEKSSSSPSQQDCSRHRIVVDNTASMAGFTVAARQGEVQEHDSFGDRGLRPKLPPIETRTSRPLHVPDHARHVASAGSEFSKSDTSTLSTNNIMPPQVSSVASSSSPVMRLGTISSTTAISASPAQTSRLASSLTSAHRKLPSSQHPNFAALFASRNSKTFEEEEDEDTDNMSVEKILPDQQVKSSKKVKRKRNPQRKSGQTAGRWTNEEHRAFLDGLKEFGREWKKVATRIPTRTSAQIRSHAQKYFAKLQREHETTMNLASSSSEHASSSGAGILVNGGGAAGGGDQGTSSMPPPQPVTPSVQRNIERLMTDPQAVQREVENTLRALRERYRQLQAQLERQQQQGRSSFSLGGHPRKPMLLQPIAAEEEEEEVYSVGSSRKRSFQEMESSQAQAAAQDHDDQSSVTTNLSASMASLGNEELIALHVLGGALPRSESNASLRMHHHHSSPKSSSQKQSIESPPKDNKSENQNNNK